MVAAAHRCCATGTGHSNRQSEGQREPDGRVDEPDTPLPAMAATTSPRCFRCQTWGHDKAACAAPGPRCGVCSSSHWMEGCLASLKNGERVKACCPNCRLGHHAWNPGCPARPTAGGDPSCSRNGLQAVLLEFSEGFAELLGVSVRCDKRAASLRPHSSLHGLSSLGRRLCRTPLLCRAVGRFKKPLAGCLPAATKRTSLTERRPRVWTWTRPSSSSPKRRKRRGARLLQQRRCWTHTLLLAA
ncbi:hypothetical protein Pcinc_023929 [Petrolisthes cinctipes]|uniref:Gag-like protein n=1 Tax=Petrolisthes cinctipes TaxID=88211 RepID=A0AAE1FE19_PETCI|nr:hypothetical protein Pcinc_023929 [Petrolisthes cinctipes]